MKENDRRPLREVGPLNDEIGTSRLSIINSEIVHPGIGNLNGLAFFQGRFSSGV
jgi:hypothetical protein